MDIDLDINNYDLPDLLNLFRLDTDFSYEDLKDAKLIALKTHPDKSGLDSKYFVFFSKAYKYLVKIFKYRFLREKQQKELHKKNVYVPDKLSNSKKHYLNKLNEMSASDFNNWFNKTFEKVKVHDDELDEGHGTWLKSNNDMVEAKNISLSQFDGEFEQQKKRIQSIVVHEGIKDIMDNADSGYSLSREKVKNYSSGLFSKLQYDDVKKAHRESIIPVTKDDFNNHKQFNNVQEYKNHRTNTMARPMNSRDANNYLANKTRKTNLEDTHRIYNMIKQDEDMEQANKQWWAYVQQLENK